MDKPTARTCEVCGKPLGVTWHRAIDKNGRTVIVRAHLRCFLRWRRNQEKENRRG